MNKTTIHCKTTAPMFMAGATVKVTERGREELVPELRVTGIKGGMRFIWRAVQCANDVKELRKTEGRLFGNAFDGKDTKVSDMRMRIENTRVATSSEVMTPHRKLRDYDGQGKAFPAQALKSDSTFDIIISSFGELETHKNFVRLFTLTCLLYGFGRRSRKGFGTVAVMGIDGDGDDIDYAFSGVVDSLNRLSLFGAKYSQPNGTEIKLGANTTANYPYIESIRIAGAQSFGGTADIIGQIGMATHHHAGNIFLGSLRPRLASSTLLSTVPWDDGSYRCIVTQLHCKDKFDHVKRADFYEELDGRV